MRCNLDSEINETTASLFTVDKSFGILIFKRVKSHLSISIVFYCKFVLILCLHISGIKHINYFPTIVEFEVLELFWRFQILCFFCFTLISCLYGFGNLNFVSSQSSFCERIMDDLTWVQFSFGNYALRITLELY